MVLVLCTKDDGNRNLSHSARRGEERKARFLSRKAYASRKNLEENSPESTANEPNACCQKCNCPLAHSKTTEAGMDSSTTTEPAETAMSGSEEANPVVKCQHNSSKPSKHISEAYSRITDLEEVFNHNTEISATEYNVFMNEFISNATEWQKMLCSSFENIVSSLRLVEASVISILAQVHLNIPMILEEAQESKEFLDKYILIMENPDKPENNFIISPVFVLLDSVNEYYLRTLVKIMEKIMLSNPSTVIEGSLEELINKSDFGRISKDENISPKLFYSPPKKGMKNRYTISDVLKPVIGYYKAMRYIKHAFILVANLLAAEIRQILTDIDNSEKNGQVYSVLEPLIDMHDGGTLKIGILKELQKSSESCFFLVKNSKNVDLANRCRDLLQRLSNFRSARRDC